MDGVTRICCLLLFTLVGGADVSKDLLLFTLAGGADVSKDLLLFTLAGGADVSKDLLLFTLAGGADVSTAEAGGVLQAASRPDRALHLQLPGTVTRGVPFLLLHGAELGGGGVTRVEMVMSYLVCSDWFFVYWGYLSNVF